MTQRLTVFHSFSVRDPAVDTRWKKWCAQFENVIVGLYIMDDKQKRDLLLDYAGEEVNEIFDISAGIGRTDYVTALTKLDCYFAPKKSTDLKYINPDR